MTELPPVSLYLTEHDIAHRLFRHSGPVHSLAQAAAERGQQPDQIVRSILFRVTVAEYVMVLIAGERQVSWRALRGYLGQSRLSMASQEEVLRVTGYQRGAVAPFGLPGPLRILVDNSVFAFAEVSIGSGVRGTTVIIRSEDLRRALPQTEMGDFADGEA